MSKQYHLMNNLLIVKNKDNLWGAFDKELKNVLPFEYDSIYCKIKEGREVFFRVKKQGVSGFVPADNVNEFIVGYENRNGEFAECLIKKKNGKYGITDVRGNFIILPVYEKIENLQLSESYNYYDVGQEEKMLSDRFLLYKDGKVGMANFSKVLCAPVYDNIKAVTDVYKVRLEHVFLAEKDGLFGYINAQGEPVCDIKYEKAEYPCTSVFTYAQYGNTIDIINVRKSKVVWSVEKDSLEYMNFDYNHCCIAKKNEKLVQVLDEDGNIIAAFDMPENIKEYQICYINRRFLGYRRLASKKIGYSIGLIDYAGKVLSEAKYSEIIPFKGTYTILAHNFGCRESVLLDEDCNVVMDKFFGLGGIENDDEFGIIPPLIYEKTDRENSPMFYTDKDLKPDTREDFVCDENVMHIDFASAKQSEGYVTCQFEFEEGGKKYIYYVPKRENKIFVLNEDGSVYKSIDFEISEEEEYFWDF